MACTVVSSQSQLQSRLPPLPAKRPQTDAEWATFIGHLSNWGQALQQEQHPANVIPSQFQTFNSPPGSTSSAAVAGLTYANMSVPVFTNVNTLYGASSLALSGLVNPATVQFTGYPIAIHAGLKWFVSFQIFAPTGATGSLAVKTSSGTTVTESFTVSAASAWQQVWALVDLTANTDTQATWIFTFTSTGSVDLDGLQMNAVDKHVLGYLPRFHSGKAVAGSLSDFNSVSHNAQQVTYDGTNYTRTGYLEAPRHSTFIESWDDPNTLNDWTNYVGNGPASIVVNGGGWTGGNILRIGTNSGNNQWWAIHNRNIPFDGNRLYRIKVRARRNSGTGLLYVGLAGVLADGVTLCNAAGANSYGSQHYCVCAGVAPPSTFTDYIGYVRGWGANSVVQSGSPGTLHQPAQMFSSVGYIRPLILANYSLAAGQIDIDYFVIEVVPENPGIWVSSNYPNGVPSDCVVHDNSFLRVAGGSGWTAAVFTRNGLAPAGGGFIAAQPHATSDICMIGFSTTPEATANYNNNQYCWYNSGTAWLIYEGNTNPYAGPATKLGDRVSITYDGTNLNYYLNGVLVRGPVNIGAVTLYGFAPLYSNGSGWINVEFGPTANPRQIAPHSGQVAATGAVPPFVFNPAFSYTSTTTSISITWSAFTLYRMDGTTVSVSAGTKAVTGLLASHTYSLYPYVPEGATTVSWATGYSGATGSPAICYAGGSGPAAAAAYNQANIPLQSFTAVTPSSGSGGGGGDSIGCLHPETAVELANGTYMLADHLSVGDELPSPSGPAKIVHINRKSRPTWVRVGFGSHSLIVTPDHRFLLPENSGEVRAEDLRLGQIIAGRGRHHEVESLSLLKEKARMVSVELDDPHLYYLNGTLSHNIKP